MRKASICKNCRWYETKMPVDDENALSGDGGWGYCHKNAPIGRIVNTDIDIDVEYKWPDVLATDYCSEFHHRQDNK